MNTTNVTIVFDRKTGETISRTPETVRINLDAIPKHEMDAYCRAVIHSVKKALQDPAYVADYEQWLIKRYGKREGKKIFKAEAVIHNVGLCQV